MPETLYHVSEEPDIERFDLPCGPCAMPWWTPFSIIRMRNARPREE